MGMSQKNRTPAVGLSAERTAHIVWRILRLDDNGKRRQECATGPAKSPALDRC
jgi:hypothetical protein